MVEAEGSKEMSQSLQILSHMKRYGSITPLTALDKYGCMRLAARVNDLRYSGHLITTEMVKAGTKRFARYRLDTKNPEAREQRG